MFCSSCGKTIPNDSEFCPECGLSLKNSPTQKTTQSGQSWTNGAMIGLVIATVLIPLVGIVMGIINLKDAHKGGQATTLLIVGIAMAVLGILMSLGGSY